MLAVHNEEVPETRGVIGASWFPCEWNLCDDGEPGSHRVPIVMVNISYGIMPFAGRQVFFWKVHAAFPCWQACNADGLGVFRRGTILIVCLTANQKGGS